ncbi:hypothetical protein [Streptomyces mangrovisoli]|uniref:Uncharacterized protein n=1 Tax=Streptomyces mangrovisoli TaxID=1428628 RepID=A0A1J4NVH0_9ACTN|nr:hypothetical protein [Streptomyces mangrovisoli]OIJ66074.1 hypothetical protein WN71_020665 [Streptomyces mangrovisoli]
MSRRHYEEVDDLGEILFSDDPALRLEGVLMSLDTADGTVILDPADTRHMPTALFEFRCAVGKGDFGMWYDMRPSASLDEMPKEPQVEGAILFGMQRLPPEFSDLRLPDPPRSDEDGDLFEEKRPTVFDELCLAEPPRRDDAEVHFGMRRRPPGYADLRSISGWELHEISEHQPGSRQNTEHTDSRLELRTPDGEIYSRTRVAHDPDWAAAARRHGHVVCLCSVELGIRAPYAMTAAQFTPPMRYESFRRGCAMGLTVGGLVAYVDHP